MPALPRVAVLSSSWSWWDKPEKAADWREKLKVSKAAMKPMP